MLPFLLWALKGFVSAYTLIVIVGMQLFPTMKMVDTPKKYGLSRKPLPYPTGILCIAAFLIFFIFARHPLSIQDLTLVACLIALAVVSGYDDLKGLPAWSRLLFQVLIGFFLFANGTRIYTLTNPFGGIISLDSIDVMTSVFGPLPVLSGIFTIAWIILTTNAFNWFDGIPGQVSVLSVIGSLTLGFLALSDRVNQPEIAVIAFLLAGVAFGSMLFDFPPNSVVLGDTGAMFFGLMLGALSIYAGGKVATAFLVLGVPLIDGIFVGLRRIISGRNPLCGGHDHLHHKLLARGWNERQVILLTVILGTAFGITALFLNTFEKFVAIILLASIMMGLHWYAEKKAGSWEL